MNSKQNKLTRVVTTTISEPFAQLAEKHNIRWADALAFGIRLIVEKDDFGRTLPAQLAQAQYALKKHRELIADLNLRIESLERQLAVKYPLVRQ